MRRKISVTLLSVSFVVTMAYTGYAQNKAVVIPLNSSKPAIVAYAEANETIAVGTTAQIIRSVTLEAPGKGLVIVNVSGNTYTGSASTGWLQCTVTQGVAVELTKFQEGYITTPPSYWNPWGATRALPVDAGSQTFNLVCVSNGEMSVQDVIMNAVFYSVPDIVVPAAAAPASSANLPGCPDNSDTSCK